jgi:hypothetical protein
LRLWPLLAAAVAACGAPPAEKSDWELRHEQRLPPREQPVTLPDYPARARLVEFSVTPGGFRFFIDEASLAVDDGIVRYALVARSPGGVDNVSYEGMRCSTGEVRIYALGRDGAWSRSPGAWRASVQRWHDTLYRDYFCPQKAPVANRREALDALRRGGHPITRNLTDDIPRGR